MDQNYDIDSLFEAAAASPAPEPTAPPADQPAAAIPTAQPTPEVVVVPLTDEGFDVFQRVGSLTRKLHDALRELGYDHQIENAVGSLPDARARLSYIADLTGRAADRVLSAVDEGMAAEDRIAERAAEIAGKLGSIQQPSLRAEAYTFALEVQSHSESARARLTDIMMAQDFHDLTGQVVKKIADVALNLEQQLVKLLMDMTPPEQRQQAANTLLEGPVVDKARTDVVHNQEQVDELLGSLGF